MGEEDVSASKNLNETVIMTPLTHCDVLNNGIYKMLMTVYT